MGVRGDFAQNLKNHWTYEKVRTKNILSIGKTMGERDIESPYTGRDFVQFGKTKSVLNKGAQEVAPLFNPPSVLSLEIIPTL